MFSLLRSLLLSTLISFATPIVLVGIGLAALFCASYIPSVAFVSHFCTNQIVAFLSIFGCGYPFRGILTIAITFALVGSLFDLFNFYLSPAKGLPIYREVNCR